MTQANYQNAIRGRFKSKYIVKPYLLLNNESYQPFSDQCCSERLPLRSPVAYHSVHAGTILHFL